METIEELRARVVELEAEKEALTGERDALKNDIKAKDERINSLIDSNSKLFQKVTTKVEIEEPKKTLSYEENIAKLCENWK